MKAFTLALLSLGVSFGQTGSYEIKLPPGVRSETVAIRYALVGPFGGYGTWVEFSRTGVRTFSIRAMRVARRRE